MPREANTAPTGVTRKRVTRRTTTSTVRKRAVPPRGSPSRVARKAPTPIASQRKRSKRSGRVALVVFFCATVTIAGSVAYGMSDKGALDPVTIIEERNERIARGESVSSDIGNTTQVVPVQRTRDARPNGGGVGMGDLEDTSPTPPPAPAPDTASSTATSSATSTNEDQTATTTHGDVAGVSTDEAE